MRSKRYLWALTFTAVVAVAAVVGLGSCAGPGGSSDVGAIARARGLTEADVVAAVKTYQPTGKFDEYIMFGSGGHSGQVVVIGVPSMRLLKVIAVFTPEPWQGYGYGSVDHQEMLAGAGMAGHDLSWGDSPTTRRCPNWTGTTTASSCSSTTRPTRASP
jgi:nitrous-oxide reductase